MASRMSNPKSIGRASGGVDEAELDQAVELGITA